MRWFQGAPALPGCRISRCGDDRGYLCALLHIKREHGRRGARIAHARPCRRKMLGRGTGTPNPIAYRTLACRLFPAGVATMAPITGVTEEQLTRALGEAVVRTWSHLPKDVQNSLFQEAVTSQGESIRPQLAVFLHAKHPRTLDPLGKPREMMEPDSLGG